jgi:hypothetical protein
MLSTKEMRGVMPTDREYTDKEVEKVREIMEGFASYAYKSWIEHRSKKVPNETPASE